MKAEVGISKTLFVKKKKYYLVINDEYYLKINRKQYYDFKKYMKEVENGKENVIRNFTIL